ncbi:MAG: Na+/H+ antiporter NhaA [Clostridium sp.]|nr:Na+/H+ antiporter NhaA [Clostridium sp.]
MNKKKSAINEESLPGILLLAATLIALIIANTPLNDFYNYALYELSFGEEFNIHFFINDFLMAIFFLAVGCEIKREIVYGKLSSIREASFPVLAAIGGMAVPAIIFTLFNYNSKFEIGAGIPLSTDIAFAIGIFAILSDKLNPTLKVFLLTLAVVDDLLSIVIIGIFYSSKIRIGGIIAAVIITIVLIIVRKFNKRNKLYPYLLIGLLLWCAVFYSGIHSTLSGVILAFTIPVYDESKRHLDLSHKLQHKLESFNNFIILPLFAFSNTGINLMGSLNLRKDYPLMLGIVLGLVIGKPLGIMLFGYIGALMKVANKPQGTTWYDVLVVSVIAGIGFTMSLFVAEIAFKNEEIEVNVAKISILIAAVISTVAAIVLSRFSNKEQ